MRLTSPRLQGVLGVVISGLALAGVVWWGMRQESPTILGSAKPLLLALAIVIELGVMALRGQRWHMILRRAGIAHDRRDAFGLVAVGYMGNNVLPARGGEALRLLLLKRRSVARTLDIFGSIVAERLLDLIALVALFALMTWIGVAGTPTGQAPAAAGLAAIVAGALGGVWYRSLRRRGRLQRLGMLLAPVMRSCRLLLGRAGLDLAALTLAAWLLEAVVYFTVARSLGLTISIPNAAFLLVLTSLSLMIPAGPGFIGTFDATLLFGLGAVGVHGGAALSFVLLVRFVLFLPITVIGLAVLLGRYNGLRELRRWWRGAHRRARRAGAPSSPQRGDSRQMPGPRPAHDRDLHEGLGDQPVAAASRN